MKVGKITADELEETVLDKIKYYRNDVLVHAGIGEDSAVVDFGDEVLVISSDPITGAVENLGYISVHITCNDIAATGARPIGLQIVLLIPDSSDKETIENIIGEIHDTATKLDVEILGGHTEILSSIQKPLIIITGIGKTDKDKYVATGGAEDGDEIILTKGMGIEGTYILANDYIDLLLEKGVSKDIIDKAQKSGNKLSVLSEGLVAADNNATGLHDITEGGLFGALEEMSRASGKGFEVEKDKLKASKETREICEVLNLKPESLLSSGSMLITASPQNSKNIINILEKKGIKAWMIGKIKNKGKYLIDKFGNKIEFNWSGEDELWSFMEKHTEES